MKKPEPIKEPTVQEYRIEVIQTGENYISQAEYQSRGYRGVSYHDGKQPERVEISIKSGTPEFKYVFDLIKMIKAQQDKISRLEKSITDFNAAHHNLRIDG